VGGYPGVNAYRVVKLDGRDAPSSQGVVLDGFIITAGQGGGGLTCISDSPHRTCDPTLNRIIFSGNQGGGMQVYSENMDNPERLVLTDITFRGNSRSGGGAGLYLGTGTQTTLTRVTFHENHADRHGGGLYVSGVVGSAVITASHVTFTNNAGGGMYVARSEVTMSDVTFCSNRGEGIYAGVEKGWTRIHLTRASFVGNEGRAIRGESYGGHLRVDLVDSFFGSHPSGAIYNDSFYADIEYDISGTTFADNNAEDGAVMVCRSNLGTCTTRMTDVQITGNSVHGNGGAFYLYASAEGLSSLTLINAQMTGNSAAGDGGIIYLEAQQTGESTADLVNTTVSGNETAGRGGVSAGAIEFGGTTQLSVFNSILWFNGASIDNEIADDGGETAPVIEYSLIQDWPNDPVNHVWGDRDPLFVAADDFRLRLPSIAIDAGDNARVPAAVTTDLDGDPRFVDVPSAEDTGRGTPPIIDMGAYEHQVAPDLTPAPTNTPLPTATPTVEPTLTPKPTDTPAPTPDPGEGGVEDVFIHLPLLMRMP
jgi:hypothetical protein